MNIIFRPRRNGKTTDIIKESAKTNSYIICKDWEECSRIHQYAINLGLKIPYPLTYHEFCNKLYYAKGIKGFIIDNADMLLQSMTSVPIKLITITDQEGE